MNVYIGSLCIWPSWKVLPLKCQILQSIINLATKTTTKNACDITVMATKIWFNLNAAQEKISQCAKSQIHYWMEDKKEYIYDVFSRQEFTRRSKKKSVETFLWSFIQLNLMLDGEKKDVFHINEEKMWSFWKYS